jgi:hypothetical protein
VQAFTEPRIPEPNQDFARQREEALVRLDLEGLDCPLRDLVSRLAEMPCCFPVESCCGHYAILDGGRRRVFDSLPPLNGSTTSVLYRVAHVALCLDDSPSGRDLLRELRAVPAIAPERVQFGCVDHLWERQINTFVLQVVPWPHRFVDDVLLLPAEATEVEEARRWFFNRLDDLVRDLRERLGA